MLAIVKIRAVTHQRQLPLRRGRAQLPLRQRRRGRAAPRAPLRAAGRRLRAQARRSCRPSSSCPTSLDPDNDADISSYGGVLYEDALAGQSAERDFGERSADDIHIIYTGGTTGFPKGVMWRHEDFWRVLGGGIDFYTGEPLDEFDQSKQATEPRMVDLPAQPADARRRAGRPADAPVRRAPDDPRAEVRPAAHLGDHRAREGPADLHDRRRDGAARSSRSSSARPATGTPYDASSLFAHLQQRRDLQPAGEGALDGGLPERDLHRLRRRHRDRLPGHGHAGQGATSPPTARSSASAPSSVVLDDDNRILDPATDVGKIGRLGRGGNVPVGYYKDPEKSARDLPRDRRRALLGARRLRPDRGGQPGHAARPRLQLRQHRRREGLPRGGRDGDQGATRPSTTASWSASPTRSTARPSPPSSSSREGDDARARRAARRSCARTCPATSCRAR